MLELALAALAAGIVAASAWRRRSPPPYTLIEDSPPLHPVVPIASAPDTGRVAFSGVVFEAEGAHYPRTLDGAPAVWVEALVEAGEPDPDRASSAIVRYVPVLAFVDAVPFWIDDGSGARARVDPRAGRMVSASSDPARRHADGEMLERVVALLVSQNKALDSRAPLFYSERVIAPGDTVLVQGALRRSGGSSYRESGQPVIEIYADDSGLSVSRRGP
jgi:hypothetical protein